MFDHLARSIVVFVTALAFAAGAAACGSDDARPGNSAPADDATAEPIPTVTADTAFEAADRGDVLLVDVREQAEWDAGHAEDAIHIPLAEVESRLDEITEQADDRPVWFVCRTGRRSERAARTAREGGVEDVAYIGGGMEAWVETGNPIVPPDGAVI